MTTSMFKKILFYFFFILFTLIALYKGSESATTSPYRTSPYSSGASVQLRGVSNGDTLQGVYNSSYGAFEFDVEKSAFYTKWYDLLGGTSYERDTTWSDATGKWITGGDAASAYYPKVNLRSEDLQSSNYTTIFDEFVSSNDTLKSTKAFGVSGYTESVTDTTIWIGSGTTINMPTGYTIVFDDKDITYHGNMLFRSAGDSNITITGGTLTSNCDSTTWKVNATVFTGFAGGGFAGDSLTVTGITVTKDSLKNWYVYNATTGKNNKLDGNGHTVAGKTKIAFATTWTTNPVFNDVLYLSPYIQFMHGMMFMSDKNVRVSGVNTVNMPGDGISLVGGENYFIENCNLYNPVFHHSIDKYDLLIGRMPISLVCNPAGPMVGPWPFESTPVHLPYLRNVTINNNILHGGYGVIDFEPNGEGLLIENVFITNNKMYAQNFAISSNVSCNIRNLWIEENDIEFVNYGIFLAGNSADYTIENVYIRRNKFTASCDDASGSAIYIRGNVHNVYVEDNDFFVSDSIGPQWMINVLNFDTLGTPKASMRTVKHLEINKNRFYNNPYGSIYMATAYGNSNAFYNVRVMDNVFENNGYRTYAAENYAPYAVNFSSVNNLTFTGNEIYEKSGRSELQIPAVFISCDSLLVANNNTYGCFSSDEFTYVNCTNSVIYSNITGYTASSIAGTDNSVNILAMNTLSDTTWILSDTLRYYRAVFDTSQNRTYTFWLDNSNYFVHGPDSTATEVIFQALGDTIGIKASSNFTDDSLNVYEYLYGTEEVVGTLGYSGIQDTISSYVTSINRLLFPGYRNVIGKTQGGSLEAWNWTTFAAPNSWYDQFTELRAYSNWKYGGSGATDRPNELFLGWKLQGKHFMPTAFIAPSDSSTTPQENEWYINTADSTMRIYINGGWVTFNHD